MTQVKSFGTLIADSAAADPSAPAVTCGDVTITRAQLNSRTNRRARHYAARGAAHGSLIVLQLPNSVELVESVVAAWKLGATPLVIPPAMPAAERAPVLELGPAALVIDAPDPDGWLGQSDQPLPFAAPPNWRASTSGGSTGRPKLIYSTRPGSADPAERTLYLRQGGAVAVPGPLYHGAPFMF